MSVLRFLDISSDRELTPVSVMVLFWFLGRIQGWELCDLTLCAGLKHWAARRPARPVFTYSYLVQAFGEVTLEPSATHPRPCGIENQGRWRSRSGGPLVSWCAPDGSLGSAESKPWLRLVGQAPPVGRGIAASAPARPRPSPSLPAPWGRPRPRSPLRRGARATPSGREACLRGGKNEGPQEGDQTGNGSGQRQRGWFQDALPFKIKAKEISGLCDSQDSKKKRMVQVWVREGAGGLDGDQ